MTPAELKASCARVPCKGYELAEWLDFTPEHVSRMLNGRRAITKATAFCMKALEAGLRPD